MDRVDKVSNLEILINSKEIQSSSEEEELIIVPLSQSVDQSKSSLESTLALPLDQSLDHSSLESTLSSSYLSFTNSLNEITELNNIILKLSDYANELNDINNIKLIKEQSTILLNELKNIKLELNNQSNNTISNNIILQERINNTKLKYNNLINDKDIKNELFKTYESSKLFYNELSKSNELAELSNEANSLMTHLLDMKDNPNALAIGNVLKNQFSRYFEGTLSSDEIKKTLENISITEGSGIDAVNKSKDVLAKISKNQTAQELIQKGKVYLESMDQSVDKSTSKDLLIKSQEYLQDHKNTEYVQKLMKGSLDFISEVKIAREKKLLMSPDKNNSPKISPRLEVKDDSKSATAVTYINGVEVRVGGHIEIKKTEDLYESSKAELLASTSTDDILQESLMLLTDEEKRDQFIKKVQDISLNFLLKYIPTIKLDPITIEDGGAVLVLKNIDMSGFEAAYENVTVSYQNISIDGLHVRATDIKCKMDDVAFDYSNSLVAASGKAFCFAENVLFDLVFKIEYDLPTPSSVKADDEAAMMVAIQAMQAELSKPGLTDNEREWILLGRPKLVIASREFKIGKLALTLEFADQLVSWICNQLVHMFSDYVKGTISDKLVGALDDNSKGLLEQINKMAADYWPLLLSVSNTVIDATKPNKIASKKTDKPSETKADGTCILN